ncbi:MAG: hypothetical protein ACPG4N_07020 [Gammaproteobacteria bacterium]
MTALCVMLPAHAGDQDAADAAVADILFDYDGSGEFASYAVDESGNVDLTMAVDTPDEIYIEILDRMRSHADINSVLAGKTGSACGLWPN